MMTKQMAFTPASISALRKGAMNDPRTAGLFIEAMTGRGNLTLTWKYRRRMAGAGKTANSIKRTLGTFPSMTIADARARAAEMNAAVETGVDPMEAARLAKASHITVADARALYMTFLETDNRRVRKPATMANKISYWNLNMKEQIGSMILQKVTEDQLWDLVIEKGQTAPIQANRTASELKTFFKWCRSRDGKAAGIDLKIDPAVTLDAYYFPQRKRRRFLTADEIRLLLIALAEERPIHQRAVLLLLLTALRKTEV